MPPVISADDLVIRKMDGHLSPGFDCGREMQNDFLYQRAWPEQRERLSTTYLYYAKGILAAYATVSLYAALLLARRRLLK